MTPADVVRAAIPNADAALVEHILWGRTPFPCGSVDARGLYQAAARLLRAERNGNCLCEMCDRLAGENGLCQSCASALRGMA